MIADQRFQISDFKLQIGNPKSQIPMALSLLWRERNTRRSRRQTSAEPLLDNIV
jgi:hypothetical protein